MKNKLISWLTCPRCSTDDGLMPSLIEHDTDTADAGLTEWEQHINKQGMVFRATKQGTP
jgi:hypothetical protein